MNYIYLLTIFACIIIQNQAIKPIRIAAITSKPHIAGALHQYQFLESQFTYFENSTKLQESKYEWFVHVVKNASTIDEAPDFLYGYGGSLSRRDDGYRQVTSSLKNMSYIMINDISRMTMDSYDENNVVLSVHATHTTHAKKRSSDPEEQNRLINEVQKNMTQFEEMLITEHQITQEKLDKLYFDINQVITYGFLAGIEHIEHSKGVFHMFGVDILIDKNWNPWFIEANQWPDLYLFSECKRQTVPPVIDGMIDITMNFHDQWEHMEQYARLLNNSYDVSGFEILYNGVSGYNILNEQFEDRRKSQSQYTNASQENQEKKDDL